ncbi:DUF3290 family protein [Nicoliella lavandulae]|uniref:DUF3290 family protein n=1 Tax=Nicoliella lavandulae TaxID=3082954 RepID=A0ABU8SMG7_9LACO
MNLYSYKFLSQNNDTFNYIFLIVMVIFGLALIFIGYKYLQNRTNLKFRDFFILLILITLLVIGMQISNVNSNSFSNGRRVADLLQQISKDEHVPLNEVYVDSTSLNSSMTAKVGNKFYNVTVNDKQTGYQISPTKVINPQSIKYINKNEFTWNMFNNNYLVLGLKLLLGFIMLVIQINLSGKSNLAQSTIIDQMQNYVLGGIIGGMIYNQDITILEFTIILLLWSIIIFAGRLLSKKTRTFHSLLIGKPRVLIRNGFVNVDAILKSGMSADDLLFNLRSNGIENFRDVNEAIFERNGSLTIFGKDADRTYSVIVDGTINHDELRRSKLSDDDLKQQLVFHHHHYKVDQVFLCQVKNQKVQFILYPQIDRQTFSKFFHQWLMKHNS